MYKKVPLPVELLGLLLRKTPQFKGKGRIQEKLRQYIKEKSYFSTVDLLQREKLLCHLDDWIPQRIFLTGQYDIESMYEESMFSFLSRGMVVLDIGANIGYYCVQFASRVGASGSVHAFEPCSTTFTIHKHNIALNGLANVILNRLILSDKHGEGMIFPGKRDNTGSSSLFGTSEDNIGEQVKMTTVDQYLSDARVSHVDIVKIDVEGSELLVLQGMSCLLAKEDAPILFIEINSQTLALAGVHPSQIIDYLGNYGYLPYKITPSGFYQDYNMVDEPLALFTKRDLTKDTVGL